MSKVAEAELERALEDLQSLLDKRLYTEGGYPAQVGVMGNYIAIADVDHDGGPDLEILDLKKFMTLWRQAKEAYEREGAEIDEDGLGGIAEHLYEKGYPEKCRAK